MPVTINGNGTITGVSVGGLPDGIVDTDMLAANAVATAKIADDAVTDAKQNLSGVAKAWVFFDDSGTVFQSSSTDQLFNVSSVSDQGSSEYHITFASAFPDGNYMPVVQASSGDNGRCAISSQTQNSSTVCKLYTRSGFTGSRSDASNNMVTIYSVV